MPSIASMRSIDPTETFQPLGPATRPAPPAAPAPANKPTGTPGVVQLPDGKLATQLPLPGSKPAAKFGRHDDYADSLLDAKSFEQEYLCKPMRASTRKPQVGDWVRVISGQDGIPPINAMIGGVFKITHVGLASITIGDWRFHPPGVTSPDGQLCTEFVEAPQ